MRADQECGEKYTYIPVALLENVSMTRFLSSSRHFRIFVSNEATEVMESMMSFFCPV